VAASSPYTLPPDRLGEGKGLAFGAREAVILCSSEEEVALPSGERRPSGRRSLSKGRLEAFSDGVFAIAITLLVLEIKIHPPGSALEQLGREWPSYIAYIISFFTIGAAWLGHTAMTDELVRVDAIFLRMNLILLLFVAFLPFPTRLIAETLHDAESERVFVTLYGLTLVAIRLMLFALDSYARRERLYSKEGDEEEDEDLRRDRRKLLPVLAGYVLAILIGLAWPVAAFAFYLALAVYLIVPFREVGRLFRRS
jgi:uncharacterized membrane protein